MSSLTPHPKLSTGSGHTGGSVAVTHAAPGTASTIYQPHGGFSYAPPFRESRMFPVPAGTGRTGRFDGAELVGYRTHTPGKIVQSAHFVGHQRSDAPWQQYEYPASRRDLIYAQVPQKYVLGNSVIIARPFNPANYFLGYQTPARAAVQPSGNSSSRPLGS